VADRQGFHAQARALLQDRVLDVAAELIVDEGWGAVTMARVALEAKVSRQLLYKQIGSRQMLGEAVVSRETDRFLEGITQQITAHRDDPLAGLDAAAGYVLRAGANNDLIKAILAGGTGSDGDLLALLAARTEPVLQRTLTTTLQHARRQYAHLDIPAERLTTTIEVFVRLTLSHLLQPLQPVDDAIRQIREVLSYTLRPATSSPNSNHKAAPSRQNAAV
jgi:AcrR family transcriptional regulator